MSRAKPRPDDAATDLATLPGLGPASAALLARAGVRNAAALRTRDAFDLYAELKALDARTTLNMLYALIGAQEDVDWRTIARERRTAIALELDARRHATNRTTPP
jgi:DNA transformation protein and related proteins